MNDEPSTELAGLYTALEIVDDRINELNAGERSETADGSADAAAEGDVTPHEVADARHGELVGVRDALYARVVELGGQWPDTEVGQKQPPTP